MKLLIITADKAYEKEALDLFKKSEIRAFSSANIHGFKTNGEEHLIDNWFSSSEEKISSVLFFTFENKTKIETLLSHLKDFNEKLESENPMKAVVLPIEQFV